MALTEQQQRRLRILQLKRKRASGATQSAPSPQSTASPQKPGFLQSIGQAAGQFLGSPRTEAAPDLSIQGTGQRFLEAHKDLVPTSFGQLLEGQKRLVDPVAGQFGPSRALEQTGEAVRQGAVAGAQERGGIGGKTGEILANTAILTPSGAQAAVGADVASAGIGKAIRPLAKPFAAISKNAGRRALGFIKSEVKKLRRSGGLERAEAVAEEMLKKKVVTPFASPQKMLDRTRDLAEVAGKQVNDVVNQLDNQFPKSGANTKDIVEGLQKQLQKSFGKVPTTQQKNALAEVVERVTQYGDEAGDISFKDLRELKQVLGEAGRFRASTVEDSVKATINQRASGLANNQLKKAIANRGGPDLADSYLAGNLTLGKALDAQRALEQAVSSGGNKFFDPFAVGAGLGATGIGFPLGLGPEAAIASGAGILALKGIRRFGPAVAATGGRAIARPIQSGAVPAARAIGQPTFRNILENAKRRQGQ